MLGALNCGQFQAHRIWFLQLSICPREAQVRINSAGVSLSKMIQNVVNAFSKVIRAVASRGHILNCKRVCKVPHDCSQLSDVSPRSRPNSHSKQFCNFQIYRSHCRVLFVQNTICLAKIIIRIAENKQQISFKMSNNQ